MSEPNSISLCYPCAHFRASPDDSTEAVWPSTAGLFWDKLASLPSEKIAMASGAHLDDEGCWQVQVLHERWRLDPPSRTASKTSGEPSTNWDRHIPFLLLVSLSCAIQQPLEDDWTTPRELYPGVDLFQGNLRLDTDAIARKFARDAEAFERAAQRLGGEPVEGGDAGARFRIFAKCPIECRLWLEDDEFPADVRLLFNRSTPTHLPGDALAVAANLLVERLLED